MSPAQVPPNLISLHGEEERIRGLSLSAIAAHADQSVHLDLIHEGMQIVHDFTHDLPHRSDDELTIQLLGIRVFNSSAGALKLALSGYYQTAFQTARDLLEITNLLDHFGDHPEKIAHWRTCSPKERKKYYEPRVVRDQLKARDGLDRDTIYRVFSQYATHATYPGFRLIAPEGQGKLGPFYDAKLLDAFIGELVKRLAFCALVYVSHFDNLSLAFLKHKADYLDKLERWRQAYLAEHNSLGSEGPEPGNL
jgi:hypothetical protein